MERSVKLVIGRRHEVVDWSDAWLVVRREVTVSGRLARGVRPYAEAIAEHPFAFFWVTRAVVAFVG